MWEFYFESFIKDNRYALGRSDEIFYSSITPAICRLRDLTYQCTIKANLHCIKYSFNSRGEKDILKSQTINNVTIAEIPIMVGSDWCNLKEISESEDERVRKGECPYDQGGYFIVKGSEKVIVAQERMAHNQVFVFRQKR
jgi:DNA-directed RNA polymerase II subunit RPB2